MYLSCVTAGLRDGRDARHGREGAEAAPGSGEAQGEAPGYLEVLLQELMLQQRMPRRHLAELG